jgi:phospholipase D1/2
VVVKPASAVKAKAGAGSAGDSSERQDFDREGNVAEGFASSIVPTLEEKTIFERRPSARHTNGKPLFDALDEGQEDLDGVQEATVPDKVRDDVESEPVNAQQNGGSNSAPKINGPANEQSKYGAPANAEEEDTGVPNRDTKRSDASEQEQAAVSARKTLRKHLAAKVGMSPVSTATLQVNEPDLRVSGRCLRLHL